MLDSQEAIAAGNYLRSQVFEKKYANVTANSETADFIAGTTASIMSSTGGLAGVLRDANFPETPSPRAHAHMAVYDEIASPAHLVLGV